MKAIILLTIAGGAFLFAAIYDYNQGPRKTTCTQQLNGDISVKICRSVRL